MQFLLGRFISDFFLLLNVAVMVLRLCLDNYIEPEYGALILAIFTVSRAMTRADNFWRLFFSASLSVAQLVLIIAVFSRGNPAPLLASLFSLAAVTVTLYLICYWASFREFSYRWVGGVLLLILTAASVYYAFIKGL